MGNKKLVGTLEISSGSHGVVLSTSETNDLKVNGEALGKKYVPKQDSPWPNTLFVYSNMDFIEYTDPANGVTTNYPLVQVAVKPNPQTIPLRDIATGVIKVGSPREDDDAVTKEYLDNIITLEDIDEICGSSIYDGTVVIS